MFATSTLEVGVAVELDLKVLVQRPAGHIQRPGP